MENLKLSYYFEHDGELYTNLDGGYAYVSNISVSADAAVGQVHKRPDRGRGRRACEFWRY